MTMPLAKTGRRRFKRRIGVREVRVAGIKYSERAQEIAWRVVHSELSRAERARK